MPFLSVTEIEKLAEQISFPCISLYMPAEKAGAETRKNPIRFKNLISEAETKLAKLGDSGDIAASLESAKSYIEDYDFWQHQASGLAFFISQTGIKYYQLDRNFEATVVVSDRFYLQPLIPIVSQDTQFYLLALSQNQVQLFLGNRDGIKQIELPDGVPPSLAVALEYDDPEKQTQYHSGDPGKSPIYHGQGVGTTDNKAEIRRFFQQLDRGIQSTFKVESIPLILAGVEYLLPIYHEVNSYQNLLEQGIIGNPENVPAAEMHHQAWAIIEAELAAAKQQQIEHYGQLAATEQTSDRLAEIVAGAANGQIDTLFLAAPAQQWGSYDLQHNQVELHQQQQRDSIDLIDFVVVNTYLQGGKVYLVEPEIMSSDHKMMAILRYPVFSETKKATV